MSATPSSAWRYPGASADSAVDQKVRPTIARVAAAAEVSPRTVSRFISDSRSVTERTRRRVEEAMRRLDYSLRHRDHDGTETERPQTSIALVALHDARPGLVHGISKGVGEASRTGGFTVTHTDVLVPHDGDVEKALFSALWGRMAEVDGVIVVATHDSVASVARRAAAGGPLVVVLAEDEGVASVTIDSYNGAVQATRHLLSLGHTAIAHVAGPQTLVHARDRREGFVDTLSAEGIEPIEIIPGEWTAQAGFVAGRRLLATTASAVFCANDQIALGVMHAFADEGRPSPGGISVVGYDDEPSAAFFSPTLTTIRQDYARVGRESVSVLAELMKTGARRHSNLVPELIVRASSAPREPSRAGQVRS